MFEPTKPREHSYAPIYQKGGAYYKIVIGDPAYPLSLICKNCGQPYGSHFGDNRCPEISQTSAMNIKLQLAIKTIYDSLTTIWLDNGNILADAVRNQSVNNLAQILEISPIEIEENIQAIINSKQ